MVERAFLYMKSKDVDCMYLNGDSELRENARGSQTRQGGLCRTIFLPSGGLKAGLSGFSHS